MRRRYEDELVTSGEVLVEVYRGDRFEEWSISYSADLTPICRATHWQPAEGGEVENLEFGEAVCTQTKERLAWSSWVERFLETEEQVREIERLAECAIAEQRSTCSYVIDGAEAA